MTDFEESIQLGNVKIDKYTHCDWRIYSEGKDSGYTDGYNQGLLEAHDNGWGEANKYYLRIFERELRKARQLLKNEGSARAGEMKYQQQRRY